MIRLENKLIMKKLIQILLVSIISTCSLFGQCGEGLDLTLSTQTQVEEFLNIYCEDFKGSLRIKDDADGVDNIKSLKLLMGLSSVNGILEISAKYLTQLVGLDSLQTVGSLRFFSNDEITSLEGLNSLKYTFGDFWFSNNAKLENFNGLDDFYIVGGYLNIHSNNQLFEIDGLSNVVSASGVLISANSLLSDLNGIAGISSSSINVNPLNVNEVSIYDNSSLVICANKFLCSVLLRDDLNIRIENNGVDCNSTDEILSWCITSVDKESSINIIIVYPNPTSSNFYIDSNEDIKLGLWDITGKKIKELELTIGTNFIDASSLDAGSYILSGKGIYERFMKI